MELQTLAERYAIARLPAGVPVPPWANSGELLAVVRTRNELSIVCRDDAVPKTHSEVQRDFRGLVVAGTLDWALTGVISRLTAPIAAAEISIFAVSTYDTHYVFVPADEFDAAKTALVNDGHVIR